MPKLSTSRIVAASLLAAVGLAIVGWFDYHATRAELLELLRGQAATLRQTVAAAARSNEAAGAVASAQVTERLLDNARLLAEIDRQGRLTQAFLDQTASRHRLFRIAVLGPDGSRELASGGGGGSLGGGGGGGGLGRGAGGGAGFHWGRGFAGADISPRLLSGEEQEAVGQMHAPRWGGGARLSAGVRRAGGGAIVLNADASAVEALQSRASLESLVHDIGASTPQLAYILLEQGDVRLVHGELPPDLSPAPAPVAGDAGQDQFAERAVDVQGRSVLEFAGPLKFGAGEPATLRLALRLDEVRRAEQRMLARLAASLTAALVLSLLALGAIWLRQAYAALSEKHALAEAALRRRDRLSAMGELASTVAHEVRNPLNAIAMSAQRLRREFLAAVAPSPAVAPPAGPAGPGPLSPGDERTELEELLGVVEGETRRINDIVQQFLEYARPPRLAPARANLGAEVKAVGEAARSIALARGVELEIDVRDAGDAVFDAAQIRQALHNLVRNALEATPAGGRVEVTARTGAKGQSVEIRDTGSGISEEDLPRIFDLYFTTKAEGTGVGLAVTQQIVSAHGGTIEVESKIGTGTRMVVRLPALREER